MYREISGSFKYKVSYEQILEITDALQTVIYTEQLTALIVREALTFGLAFFLSLSSSRSWNSNTIV